MQYFYHITDKQALPSIMEKGLIPQIGENSKIVQESEPCIFLCDNKSIPYWKAILGKKVVLQITGLDIGTMEGYPYHDYNEFIWKETIPPERIKRIHTIKTPVEIMRSLCTDYLWNISNMTRNFAMFYMYHEEFEQEEELLRMIKTQLKVIKNLDFSVLTTDETKDILINMGNEGEYTFLDTYLDTNERLWSQLIRYPEDSTTKYRQELYDFITLTFTPLLYVNTGGWTG